jgi:NADH:ubiquinone oxidoreductase subunit 6 (subunit J)
MRRSQLIRSSTAAFAALAALLASSASGQRNDEAKFVDAAKVLEVFTTDEEHGIPAGFDAISELGNALVSPDAYVLPFEVASVLLVAALVGAVYVAYNRK